MNHVMKIDTVRTLWNIFKDDYAAVKYALRNTDLSIPTIYKFLHQGIKKELIMSRTNPTKCNGKCYKVIYDSEFPEFYVEFER